jgi:hypothetical protein
VNISTPLDHVDSWQLALREFQRGDVCSIMIEAFHRHSGTDMLAGDSRA